jgi:hypothetical protein
MVARAAIRSDVEYTKESACTSASRLTAVTIRSAYIIQN